MFLSNSMAHWKLIIVLPVVLVMIFGVTVQEEMFLLLMPIEIHKDTNYFSTIETGKKPPNISNNKGTHSHDKGIISNVLHYWFSGMTFHKGDKAGMPRKAEDVIVSVITPFSRDI